MIQSYERWASRSNTGRVSHSLQGAVPRGREAPPAQDDLHAVLRPERDARDALPQVREQGTAAESEGSAEGVAIAFLGATAVILFHYVVGSGRLRSLLALSETLEVAIDRVEQDEERGQSEVNEQREERVHERQTNRPQRE